MGRETVRVNVDLIRCILGPLEAADRMAVLTEICPELADLRCARGELLETITDLEKELERLRVERTQ